MLKYAENMEILIFHKFILNMNISLIRRVTCLKIVRHVLKTNLEGRVSQSFEICLKPIFHQNAKYLASGAGVGQWPRRQNFALEIPTCWYILALPKFAKCWRRACTFHVFCVDFICVGHPTPTLFLVEYGL